MAQSRRLFVTIDQGGHASRALVFDEEGSALARGRTEVAVNFPRPGWVEQDAEDLIASVRSALFKALGAGDNLAGRLIAAGLATQRSSIVCWDRESGAALSPAISWQDRRAHAWLRQFAGHGEAIHRVTGLMLSAHYGASKLRWCLDHLPAVQRAQRQGRLCCGPLASFLAFRLLEERPLVADPANAARTLLWGLRRLDWEPELLELFGVPRALLPVCVPSRHAFGHLRLNGNVVPMRVITGDQSAALFAYGAPQPDAAYVNIGTGAFVQRTSGHHPGHAPRLLTGVVLQEDHEMTYVLEGTVNGAGAAFDWAERELELPDLRSRLDAWLESGVAPPLFLNGISGLGAPFWIADFASRFEGEGTPAEKACAVAESVVFLIQANLDELRALASPPQHLIVSGGLAVHDALCRRLADLGGLPVYRPVEREATARGLAYLLAGKPTHWPEQEFGVWFKPQPNEALMSRYRRWRALMPRLSGPVRPIGRH